MRLHILIATLLLASCKTPASTSEARSTTTTAACGQYPEPTFDFGPWLDELASLPPFAGVTPRPAYERSEYYAAASVLASDLYSDLCYVGWTPQNDDGALALAGGMPRHPRVAARVPHVDEEAYAARPAARPSYRRIRAEDAAHLHSAQATIRSRRQTIRTVETPDVMSAAAHLDLRDPAKVFFFARMIKVHSEPGKHPAEESAKASDLMRKFAEQPIQINVFTKVIDGKVTIEHVECVDGNHRLAAGLVSGKWRTIDDIPTEFLDIRVNGSRTADRRGGLAEKDLHWLPARIADEAAFKGKFREISAQEFEGRVQRAGRYDPSLLGETEFFRVPEHYGPAAPSIALRPEIPSSHPAMGGHQGVPMWQVVRRTLIRDGIVNPEDFQE